MTCRICVKIRHFTIKRRQLNTPRWRSKPLLSFLFTPQPLLFLSLSLSLSLTLSLSLSLWLSGSFSLPHSLFEEVRFSLSLLFFSYRCRRAASALNIIVGGSCAAAVRLWEVLRSRRRDDWQRIQPTREPNAPFAAALFLVAGAFFFYFFFFWLLQKSCRLRSGEFKLSVLLT